MRITKHSTPDDVPGDRHGFNIENLTAGQLAYLIGILGMSNSHVNRLGKATGQPVVPEAHDMWQPLQLAMVQHGLGSIVTDVERAQDIWRRKLYDIEDAYVGEGS